MNFKKTMLAAMMALGCLSISAQETETVNVFEPHWYVQVQGGVQHTLGEVEFSDLLSPNAQVGVGYQFDKIFGARLSVNAWQSKAGSDFAITNVVKNANGTIKSYSKDQQSPRWKWNYVAPMVDITMNISNLVCGYNPERVFNLSAFLGVGANYAFNNDEATEVYNKYVNSNLSSDDQFLRYYWEGSKLRLAGRGGLIGDFRLCDRVSLGLEVNANILSDRYNSKKAGDRSVDWYFNALAGVKINLGKTHSKKEVKGCEPVVVEKIVEKPVEKIVEKIVEKPVVQEQEPLREVVYYAIRISDPNADEVINKVVAWCNKYPTKGVSVRGYADKGTGNAKVNQGYAKKRADKIAAKLQAQGIDETRISVSSYGDKVQPFKENDKNRCVIIVGE